MYYASRRQSSKPAPWTDEQTALLEKLRGYNMPWEDIAGQCGHSANSCRAVHSTLKRLRRERAEGVPPPKKTRRWSEADIIALRRMHAEGKRFSAIDAVLGKGVGAACSKWHSLHGPARPQASTRQEPLSRAVLVEHDSLTAQFCGDPLPGRSALDRKRAGISDDARRPSLATRPAQSEERAP